MQLSEHFSLQEMIKSNTASRLGINNSPNEQETKNLRRLCEQILEPARRALGPLSINSGFRSKRLNAAVPGSSDTSAHTLGYAGDVDPVEVSKMTFARWVYENCEFDQIILEYGTKDEPAWIHVSADPRNRKQVLRKLKGTGYIPVKL